MPVRKLLWNFHSVYPVSNMLLYYRSCSYKTTTTTPNSVQFIYKQVMHKMRYLQTYSTYRKPVAELQKGKCPGRCPATRLPEFLLCIAFIWGINRPLHWSLV